MQQHSWLSSSSEANEKQANLYFQACTISKVKKYHRPFSIPEPGKLSPRMQIDGKFFFSCGKGSLLPWQGNSIHNFQAMNYTSILISAIQKDELKLHIYGMFHPVDSRLKELKTRMRCIRHQVVKDLLMPRLNLLSLYNLQGHMHGKRSHRESIILLSQFAQTTSTSWIERPIFIITIQGHGTKTTHAFLWLDTKSSLQQQ